MGLPDCPDLSLAIARLTSAGAEHFAIWVLKAPVPGGYVHHDGLWPVNLTQRWLAWQEMFALQQQQPHVPVQHPNLDPTEVFIPPTEPDANTQSYGGRLMQAIGTGLWQWLFQGPVRNSLAQSRGIAIGQQATLRLRLDIRDPNLIPLPWETMQSAPGRPAIALSQQVLFSRTTSDVDPLSAVEPEDQLRILLVLGQPQAQQNADALHLEQEAALLSQVIQQGIANSREAVGVTVETLVQPSPMRLIRTLEQGRYNIFFYAGHGMPAPDGGLLLLSPQAQLNGTELAQVLVRSRVTLALFNACWGARPEQSGQVAIPRSSLAEVLIHHGVPAVLGMRDAIADQEALTFIQTFTTAITQRKTIDQAVAIARQQLLTLYKFNQPAWTLPILYMHPEFKGELLRSIPEGITELPTILPTGGQSRLPIASVRSHPTGEPVWPIRGGLMRVGRRPDNDLVVQERWVSQNHAEIFYRETLSSNTPAPRYFLRDFSRYGTLILQQGKDWERVHHQEAPLRSGSRLKFGSSQGQELEFVIESTYE
ncbi:MAG: CHAT domain-containing protein [Spirulina sp. SIO3F2]|nr:CHAT domain-containing protein [Spirulina sp. SIO3F2]